MRKMRSKKLMLIMIAGFFVLFAGINTAQAQSDDVPTSCINDMGWTTILLEVSPGDSADCGYDPCYIWTYNVQNPKSNTKGLNHINFNISAHPSYDAPATLIGEYDNSASVAIYYEGAGDPTTNFGKGILQDYVVKFTPQSTNGTWSFISNTDNMATATVGLKINNNLGICEIGVPYAAEFAAMAVSSEQIITTTETDADGNNKNFKILEDPNTQCILKAQYRYGDNGNWIDMTKSDLQSTLNIDDGEHTKPIEYLGVPGQGCPRAIIKREGNLTWYFISGRYVWRQESIIKLGYF